MKISCHYFHVNIETWQQNDFQEHDLFCSHDNQCHYAHKFSDFTHQFWFSTQYIWEMIFEWSQLKQQQELKQESESDNFNIWDEKNFIFAELYDIDSNFNFNF